MSTNHYLRDVCALLLSLGRRDLVERVFTETIRLKAEALALDVDGAPRVDFPRHLYRRALGLALYFGDVDSADSVYSAEMYRRINRTW